MKFNSKLNRVVKSVGYKDLRVSGFNCEVSLLELNRQKYVKWVKKYFPDYRKIHQDICSKKLIELYTTFFLLKIKHDETYMDAAGGKYSYVDKIKSKKGLLQDIRISEKLKEHFPKKVSFIESDAGKIPLKNESMDCISCHHSFEHFQGNSDIKFIKEIQRLLSKKGRCAIIPMLIGNKYIEVSDREDFKKHFDRSSKKLIDKTAILPGGKHSGNFARIYDIQAFQRRVLKNIDNKKFEVILYELRINQKPLPNMKLACHKIATKINYPYRVLFIRRKKEYNNLFLIYT